MDFVPFPFDQTLDSLKYMVLTTAIWIDPVALLQPWSEEESRLKVTVRPFELPVGLKFPYNIWYNPLF